MKKHVLIIIACIALSAKLSAQENPKTDKAGKENDNSIFTGLKPSDGRAYVFGSEKEKEAGISGKRNNVIDLIKKNQSDPERVKLLRMELWRIDNATVAEPKQKASN